LAAATSAASCASISRSTATSSCGRPAALADEGTMPMAKVAEAIAKYGIKTDKINPLYA
jgi:pyruvate dehydrogenase complex dehydrogenase (E1) component